eukprot:c21103_g1_i1.p1 GENE.c21103_g1_i1~~c21103_g1_i1.p1  ORF type:complete len:190 (+),score=50.00 c21103_g1_i1:53-622(+)
MSGCSVSKLASTKILLHAGKYLYTSVNGIAVGKVSSSGDIQIEDVVPLFHQHLSLLPLLEVALIQIEAYCAANGQTLVGYYHGNEHVDDEKLPNIAKIIAEKIQLNTSHNAVILQIRNLGFNDGKVLKGFVKSKDWTEVDLSLDLSLADVKGLGQLIQRGQAIHVNDFHDHVNNVALPWLGQPAPTFAK